MLVYTLYSVCSNIQCLCPPGCAAKDSDSGDEHGELPFSGEQNEAHDSLSGAGEGSLPENHWTHALVPSSWRLDRCRDDPDQNRAQRESQNSSQKALMATRVPAAVGQTHRQIPKWTNEDCFVESCWVPPHCCNAVQELYTIFFFSFLNVFCLKWRRADCIGKYLCDIRQKIIA